MEQQKIIKALKQGGVVLIPTDTVMGLFASPVHPKAVDKIYELKQRPKEMFLPIMVASKDDLLALGVLLNDKTNRLLDSELVPGSLTIVLGFESKPLVPWLAGREEIAIRIPDDERLLRVLEEIGPLLATSANIHGAGLKETDEAILKELNGVPDLVIAGAKKGDASTIINCRKAIPKIEREGAISASVLDKILNE